MSKEKTLVPKLRFGEFNENWSPKKIGDGYRLQGGYAFKSSDFDVEGNLVVRISNVTGSGISLKNSKRHRTIPNEDSFVIRKGDLLIAMSGATTGKTCVYDLDEKAYLNQRVGLFRKKSALQEQQFLSAFVQSKRFIDSLSSLLVAGAQPNIGSRDIESIQFPFPTLPEQKKIAAFLTSVDTRIDQLKRKKSLLQDYKKGVMSRLFAASNDECGMMNDECQQNETAPNSALKTQHSPLRFRDENGNPFPDWQEKKLGEVYSYITTNSLSRDKLNYDSGEVFNIHYGDIHTKFRSHFYLGNEKVPYLNDTAENLRIKDECYLCPSDIVIADASEDYADIGKSIEIMDLRGQKVVAGLHTYILRPDKDQIASGFGAYLLQARPTRLGIIKVAQGTKVLGLPKGYLAGITIKIPSKPEQTKIANALTALDRKIEQIDTQITQTQTFKRGLLQQMFV